MELALGFRDLVFFCFCIFFQAIMKLECFLFVSHSFFIGGMSVHLQLSVEFEPILNVQSLQLEVYYVLKKKLYALWYLVVVFLSTLHIVFLFMHSSHHVYAHSSSSSVFITIFNDLNFSTFDDLDFLIATLSDFNLLAFSNPGLQL